MKFPCILLDIKKRLIGNWNAQLRYFHTQPYDETIKIK